MSHQGAIVSNGNGGAGNGHSTPKGVPIPAHDLNGMSNGFNQQGANPKSGWSQSKQRDTIIRIVNMI
jgi:hypothetical protein